MEIKETQSKQIPGDELIVSITDMIEDPIAFISVLNTLIFSPGNFSVIGGKQKSRKTFFVSMLIAAFLKKQWGCLYGNPPTNPCVLLFDTEQGKAHVYKVVWRIYRMMGWTKDEKNLRVYYLREKTVDERKKIISAQMEKYHPNMVFIDGIVDLCNDFNSIEDATETVQFLMKLSASHNTHISVVLHENKADGNLRGHLGSIAIQKAETAIKLTKDGDVTKVSAEATRNMGFNDFCFRVDEDGIPQIIQQDCPTKTNVVNSKIQNGMKRVLGITAMNYARLCQEYSESEGVGGSTAKKHISMAMNAGYISKGSDGNYRVT